MPSEARPPDRDKICTGKKRFPQFILARFARRSAARTKEALRQLSKGFPAIYRCPWCQGWHVADSARSPAPSRPAVLRAYRKKDRRPLPVRLRWNTPATSVAFGPLRWEFTYLKARVILPLLDASSAGFPEVSGRDLRQTSGVRQPLRKLFFRDPAWRKLLVPCDPVRRGFYRIATLAELQFMLRMHQAQGKP